MSGQVGGAAPVDPSMEDVLASIRRILSEDEKQPSEEPDAAAAAVDDEEPFSLTPEMIVAQDEPQSADVPPARSEGGLVAPAVAAAAAAALGTLTRNVAPEPTGVSRGGGPTIEDLVREELRPLLKEWLDAHLPALVERIVRNEIERVVHRSAG
jgi:cell pole-organizing protein PopZ